MGFKIDTKEKFTVIQPLESFISANMTAELKNVCLGFLGKDVKNIILNFEKVDTIEVDVAQAIVELQQDFYNASASFVICNIQPTVIKIFEEQDLDDLINKTPSESEAWDIVQMEEIERELLDGDDFDF
jgi:anti-anti-sigma regulatory factor